MSAKKQRMRTKVSTDDLRTLLDRLQSGDGPNRIFISSTSGQIADGIKLELLQTYLKTFDALHDQTSVGGSNQLTLTERDGSVVVFDPALLDVAVRDGDLYQASLYLKVLRYEEEIRRTDFAVRSRRAHSLLDAWSCVLPQRIVDEEIGDYLEDINRRICEGQKWRVRLRLFAAIFWTALNAIGYTVKDLLGKRQAG